MSEPIIEARGVSKAFGRTPALRGVDLAVTPGEVLAVTGASGSGKSTLLLTLAGVVTPDGGQVWHGGRRVDDLSEAERAVLRRKHIGLVLQFGQLVPELTVEQNVALPLLLERVPAAERRERVKEALVRFGVVGLGASVPGELSGGEAQRVAVARAVVSRPSVILADEPTGALDTVGAEEVLELLVGAAAATDAALVIVTHDNRVAARADRRVTLKDGTVDGLGIGQPLRAVEASA